MNKMMMYFRNTSGIDPKDMVVLAQDQFGCDNIAIRVHDGEKNIAMLKGEDEYLPKIFKYSDPRKVGVYFYADIKGADTSVEAKQLIARTKLYMRYSSFRGLIAHVTDAYNDRTANSVKVYYDAIRAAFPTMELGIVDTTTKEMKYMNSFLDRVDFSCVLIAGSNISYPWKDCVTAYLNYMDWYGMSSTPKNFQFIPMLGIYDMPERGYKFTKSGAHTFYDQLMKDSDIMGGAYWNWSPDNGQTALLADGSSNNTFIEDLRWTKAIVVVEPPVEDPSEEAPVEEPSEETPSTCPTCGGELSLMCPVCDCECPSEPEEPEEPEEPVMNGVLPILGKGCYIWRPQNLFAGDVNAIVNSFVEAKVQHVCIKVSDGYYTYPDIIPLANALRAAGIHVGAWGYIYLKWIPKTEAEAISNGAIGIGAEYVLLDIEDPASYGQYTNASIFMNRYRELLPNMPTALNSYWKPSYHGEIPYTKVRVRCDFDAPQIYSRGTDPVKKYDESAAEYAELFPRLQFALPAGDMYFEGGIKPRPGDITKFMKRAKEDPEAKGVIMWAADQRETTPELWAEFAAYNWELGTIDPIPPIVPPVYQPLYAAVVFADFLYIRNRPDISGGTVGYYKKGDRVTVYKIEGSWSCVDAEKDWWCGSRWLKRL